MAPTTYSEVLARNVRSARTRLDIEQESLATRMRNLGFTVWNRQTVSKVERGNRRIIAEEISGLAYALETTISRLMAPLDEDKVVEFQEDGPEIPVYTVRLSAVGTIVPGALQWDGDKPVISTTGYPAGTAIVLDQVTLGHSVTVTSPWDAGD